MDKNSRRAIRGRLLAQNLNWWKGDEELYNNNINYLRNVLDIEYRPGDKKFYNLLAQNQKPSPKVGKMLRCDNCIKKGVTCSGPTNPRMRMCTQCAVAGLEEKDCVYSSLNLNLPAWASGGAGGAANAVIQPAEAGAGGAGLAIRIPLARNEGKGSPTGFMEDVDEEEYNENATNSNASRDPTASAEQVARGRAKKEARRKKVANNLAKSALNNMAAGNESAKAVQAMAKAAGAGGKRSRKQKQKNLKRKQKFTRKQK
jgi:hypothetical protein